MNTVSVLLSIAEFVLVAATLGELVVALSRGRRLSRLWLAAIAVTALTVAQPLGIVAQRSSEPIRAVAGVSAASSVHVARLLGLPLMPFVVYSQSIPLASLGENAPQDKLKVRSWVWGPILTNATVLTDECDGSINLPCWHAHSAYGERTQLSLVNRNGWYLTARAHPHPSSVTDAPAPFAAETWKLSVGIASPSGLVYWIVIATGLVALGIRTRRGAGSGRSLA